jgi:hypothetical protein
MEGSEPRASSGGEAEEPLTVLISEGTLGYIPTLYFTLIDELEKLATDKSRFGSNPYQIEPKLLLKSLNPRYQLEFWRKALPSITKPDGFRDELPFAGQFILKF